MTDKELLISIKEKVDLIENRLFISGNGKRPLCEQVNNNSDDIEYLKNKNTILRRWLSFFIQAGMFGIALLALLWRIK